MSKQKETVRRFAESIGKGTLTREDCYEIFADEHQDIPNQGEPPGPETQWQKYLEAREAFADMHFEFHELVEEGNRVAVVTTFTGKHVGEFNGIPATGRSFEIYTISLWCFNEEGKNYKEYELFDTVTMLTQLGVLEAPATA